jgi:sterol desaturase/sphingolipid hydroxylase (fatty acid hydroxylase superfamily)
MPLWLQSHLYPLVSLGGLWVWWAAPRMGLAAEAAVMVWSLAVLALGWGLERRWPFEPGWHASRAGDHSVDATSAVVLMAGVDPLLKAGLPLLAAAGVTALPALAGLWPQEWPLAVQWMLALLWVELAKYAMHRAHHEWGPLWRLHALHHGSERLYWLNNFRVHPLNFALVTAAALLPLQLVGAPADLLLGVLAFTQPVLLLQHSNADLRSGRWNGLFSTNEAHRWHHSTRPAEANRNYGAALLVWDHVFGSYLSAPAGQRPQQVGLFGDGSGYPARASFWCQLLAGRACPSLIQRRCCA